MKKLISSVLTILLGLSVSGAAFAQAKQAKPTKKEIPNRLIDYRAFQKIVFESGKLREQRRLTETDFLKMMSEENVVILDARTDKRYAQLHVHGAVNLPFTEFTAQSLAKVIPNKKTKILIYCNNNFLGNQIALASKSAGASLNLSTFTSLMTYGYKNIYELGPLLDVRTTQLPFDGEHVGLQKLFAASTDWRSKMTDRTVHYKFLRVIEGPDAPLSVFQETTDPNSSATLAEIARARVGGNGGLLIEDTQTPGKYVVGVTGKDLHDYLYPTKPTIGQENNKRNLSATPRQTVSTSPFGNK
jgi:rhodanese-related sulfurtransferase